MTLFRAGEFGLRFLCSFTRFALNTFCYRRTIQLLWLDGLKFLDDVFRQFLAHRFQATFEHLIDDKGNRNPRHLRHVFELDEDGEREAMAALNCRS